MLYVANVMGWMTVIEAKTANEALREAKQRARSASLLPQDVTPSCIRLANDDDVVWYKTMTEPLVPSGVNRQSEIDRGLRPAKTIRELASAIRQNTSAAVADLATLRLAHVRRRPEQAQEAGDRLLRHLEAIERKLKLAVDAVRSGEEEGPAGGAE